MAKKDTKAQAFNKPAKPAAEQQGETNSGFIQTAQEYWENEDARKASADGWARQVNPNKYWPYPL